MVSLDWRQEESHTTPVSKRSDTLRGPLRMYLTVFSGKRPERTVEITGPRFVIGRGEGCDLVIDDPKASREHAAILASAGPFRMIRDLGSANGTLVDGRSLRVPVGFSSGEVKEAELTGGEWLHFGDTAVQVTLVDPRDPPTQPLKASPGDSEKPH